MALGSNQAHRAQQILQALSALKRHSRILNSSFLYETEPMYIQEQPKFLNCIVEVSTALEPQALLSFTQAIEQAQGRDPHKSF